jgi:hypothetical protein
MKLKLNDIVEIEWVDIVTHSVWIPQEEAKEKPLCQCKSVGYFLNQDDKIIRISCTIQLDDKPERDLTVIPKGCITKIRRLK